MWHVNYRPTLKSVLIIFVFVFLRSLLIWALFSFSKNQFCLYYFQLEINLFFIVKSQLYLCFLRNQKKKKKVQIKFTNFVYTHVNLATKKREEKSEIRRKKEERDNKKHYFIFTILLQQFLNLGYYCNLIVKIFTIGNPSNASLLWFDAIKQDIGSFRVQC